MTLGNKKQTNKDPWAPCPVMTLYLANSKLGGPMGAGMKRNMSQGCIIFTTQEPGAGEIGSTEEWGTCCGQLTGSV